MVTLSWIIFKTRYYQKKAWNSHFLVYRQKRENMKHINWTAQFIRPGWKSLTGRADLDNWILWKIHQCLDSAVVQVPNFSILWRFWGIKVCLRVYLYQNRCNINHTCLSICLGSDIFSILLLIGRRRWGGEPRGHLGGNSQCRGLDVTAMWHIQGTARRPMWL